MKLVEREKKTNLWYFEQAMRSEAQFQGRSNVFIAGVDEAGRGPLAGPVVAAAVVLPEDFDLTGIDDSKRLSPSAREKAFVRIEADAQGIGVGIVSPSEIDRLNILRATHEAMRFALADLTRCLKAVPDVVLVDGLPVPRLHDDCRALVKGDSLSASIAAASIVAKVTRDRLMCGVYHEQFPQYDFPRHKGYPSPAHLAALNTHGPCVLHRRSFGPVAQCVLRFEQEEVESTARPTV